MVAYNIRVTWYCSLQQPKTAYFPTQWRAVAYMFYQKQYVMYVRSNVTVITNSFLVLDVCMGLAFGHALTDPLQDYSCAP